MARTDQECIFCRIVRGEIPGDRVYENDVIVAFRDIQPAAPTHVLIVPREHIRSVSDLRDDDTAIAGKLLQAARTVAAQEGLVAGGYRVITNTGEWGGLLGGRQLGALG
jgi:histidine triad (HIT) family protein